MENEIKTILMKLLMEDEEVINVVKEIKGSESPVSESNLNKEMELLQQIQKLNEDLLLITQQKERFEQVINRQKADLEKMEMGLKEKDVIIESIKKKYLENEKIKDDIIEQYDSLKKYVGLDAIYNKYLGLGDPIIKRMERILNCSAEVSETPELFMAYGIQENNIVALWESIATNFELYDSYGKTQDLIDIFQYFLGLYKEITFKQVSINWPKLGESFDERIHMRVPSSNVVGKIQQVILPGFSIGKNIFRKSLVIAK